MRQDKVEIVVELFDPDVREKLKKHFPVVMEAWYCRLWGTKPFLFKMIGRGLGCLDFGGKPHKTDVCAYGATLQDAVVETLAELDR